MFLANVYVAYNPQAENFLWFRRTSWDFWSFLKNEKTSYRVNRFPNFLGLFFFWSHKLLLSRINTNNFSVGCVDVYRNQKLQGVFVGIYATASHGPNTIALVVFLLSRENHGLLCRSLHNYQALLATVYATDGYSNLEFRRQSGFLAFSEFRHSRKSHNLYNGFFVSPGFFFHRTNHCCRVSTPTISLWVVWTCIGIRNCKVFLLESMQQLHVVFFFWKKNHG